MSSPAASHDSPAQSPRQAPGPSRGGRAWAVLRRPRTLAWIALAVVVLVIAAALYFSGRESTDNARIEGHVHPVAPRIEGTVAAVHVRENDAVEVGQLLFELDPRDVEVAHARAEADLAAAEAAALAARAGVPVAETGADSRLTAASAGLSSAVSGVEVARQARHAAEQRRQAAEATRVSGEAELTIALREVERLRPLVEKDQVTRKRFEDAEATARSITARVAALDAQARAASAELEMTSSRVDQAQRTVEEVRSRLSEAQTAPEQKELSRAEATAAGARAAQARAALERANLDLEYTQVRAPAAGIVSRKSVEVGQVVRAGQPLLAIVALDDVWTIANFKETQLAQMRPGQPARVRVDAYSGEVRRGRVESIGAATGSRFALLPADNATGNFVKVVQRIPVKIAFDEPNDARRPLRPGMSVVVEVSTRGGSSHEPPEGAAVETSALEPAWESPRAPVE